MTFWTTLLLIVLALWALTVLAAMLAYRTVRLTPHPALDELWPPERCKHELSPAQLQVVNALSGLGFELLGAVLLESPVPEHFAVLQADAHTWAELPLHGKPGRIQFYRRDGQTVHAVLELTWVERVVVRLFPLLPELSPRFVSQQVPLTKRLAMLPPVRDAWGEPRDLHAHAEYLLSRSVRIMELRVAEGAWRLEQGELRVMPRMALWMGLLAPLVLVANLTTSRRRPPAPR